MVRHIGEVGDPRTSVQIPREVHRAARIASARSGRPLIELVSEAIATWLYEHDYELPEGWAVEDGS